MFCLADRCTIIELYPLTLPEFRTDSWDDTLSNSVFQQLLKNQEIEYYPSFLLDHSRSEKFEAYIHYLKYGGFPGSVVNSVGMITY